MREQQRARVANEISTVGSELKQKIETASVFNSRVTLTVQQGTAINLKHKSQGIPLNGEARLKMDDIREILAAFQSAVMLAWGSHSFFVAWIDISYNGSELSYEPTVIEVSRKLTV